MSVFWLSVETLLLIIFSSSGVDQVQLGDFSLGVSHSTAVK
jgi:hypothetical protein